jgi:hypothetical protein
MKNITDILYVSFKENIRLLLENNYNNKATFVRYKTDVPIVFQIVTHVYVHMLYKNHRKIKRMINLNEYLINDINVKLDRELNKQYYNFKVYVRITLNMKRLMYSWRGNYI